MRVVHSYYDGVRRVQEVVDPFGWYSPQPIAEGDEDDPTAWCDREYVHGVFIASDGACGGRR